MVKYDYGSLEQRLRALTASLETYTDAERTEILRFVDLGEFGVALETAFSIAVEEGKTLSKASKQGIVKLAFEMGLGESVDIARL
jgi:hypothetical protein